MTDQLWLYNAAIVLFAVWAIWAVRKAATDLRDRSRPMPDRLLDLSGVALLVFLPFCFAILAYRPSWLWIVSAATGLLFAFQAGVGFRYGVVNYSSSASFSKSGEPRAYWIVQAWLIFLVVASIPVTLQLIEEGP